VTRTGAELLPPRGPETDVWLVRHAEVHEDWRGKAYGDLDVPLSAAGRAHTDELARLLAELGPARVASSPLERARTLGERTATLAGRPLSVHPELREIHRGDWQGRAVSEPHTERAAELGAFYADPWSWRGHGGESDSMVAERAVPLLRALIAEHAGGTLVVATHYNVIRVSVTVLLGLRPERSFGLRVDPGRAVHLVAASDGVLLRHSNLARPGGAPAA